MTIEERNTARAIQDIARELKEIRWNYENNDSPKIIDWEERRYEIARELFTRNLIFLPNEYLGPAVGLIAVNSVTYADVLIEELKKK